MKIETKFNLKDQVYYIDQKNSIATFIIGGCDIHVNDKDQVVLYGEFSENCCILERNLFNDKEKAKLELIERIKKM